MEYKEQTEQKHCLECGQPIYGGRPDRKFCTDTCKNRYHNVKSGRYRMLESRMIVALQRNRDILNEVLKAGHTVADISDLVQMGYCPEFVTCYRKHLHGDEFRCFDIRFRQSRNRIFALAYIEQISTRRR